MPQSREDDLFPKDYWDRPASLNRGDPSAVPIHHAVGAALSVWELAEEAFFRLFLVMTECGTSATVYNAVRRAFGSIESSAGRRKALEQVAPIYFAPYWPDESIKRLFNQVIDNFSRASRIRDDIAHGIAIGFVVDKEDFETFLVPADYNSGRNLPFPEIIESDKLSFERGSYRYTSDKIMSLSRQFVELRNKTIEYTRFVTKKDGMSKQIRRVLEKRSRNQKASP